MCRGAPPVICNTTGGAYIFGRVASICVTPVWFVARELLHPLGVMLSASRAPGSSLEQRRRAASLEHVVVMGRGLVGVGLLHQRVKLVKRLQAVAGLGWKAERERRGIMSTPRTPIVRGSLRMVVLPSFAATTWPLPSSVGHWTPGMEQGPRYSASSRVASLLSPSPTWARDGPGLPPWRWTPVYLGARVR